MRSPARHERPVPDVSAENLRELLSHSWPGNVRELRNVAERHVLGLNLSTGATVELLQQTRSAPLGLAEQVAAFEKCLLQQALRENGGSMQETGRALGLAARTLSDKMRRHNLDRRDFT